MCTHANNEACGDCTVSCLRGNFDVYVFFVLIDVFPTSRLPSPIRTNLCLAIVRFRVVVNVHGCRPRFACAVHIEKM